MSIDIRYERSSSDDTSGSEPLAWLNHLGPIVDTAVPFVDLRNVINGHPGCPPVRADIKFGPRGCNNSVSVDLIKLVGASISDRPFWARKPFIRAGGRVAIAGLTRHSFFALEDGSRVIARSALVTTGKDSLLVPALEVSAPLVDSTLEEELNDQINKIGVATLWDSALEKLTLKSETSSIAERAGVLAPRSVFSGEYPGNDSLFEQLLEDDMKDVVIKPVSGGQGEGVVFHNITDFDGFHAVVGSMDKQYVVEERVRPPGLVLDGLLHDWNFRIVVIEGVVTNYYVRASAQEGPVNISTGAFLLPWRSAKRYIDSKKKPSKKDIEQFGLKVGQVFPEGVLGIDAILDERGELQLIEVNSGHVDCMGDPDRDVFTRREKRRAAKLQVMAYRKAGLRSKTVDDSAHALVDITPDLTHSDFFVANNSLLAEYEKIRDEGDQGIVTSPVILIQAVEIFEALVESELDLYSKKHVLSELLPLIDSGTIEDPESERAKVLAQIKQKIADYRIELKAMQDNDRPILSKSEERINPTAIIQLICAEKRENQQNPFFEIESLMTAYDAQPTHTLLSVAAEAIASRYASKGSKKHQRKFVDSLLSNISIPHEDIRYSGISSNQDNLFTGGLVKLLRMIDDPTYFSEADVVGLYELLTQDSPEEYREMLGQFIGSKIAEKFHGS